MVNYNYAYERVSIENTINLMNKKYGRNLCLSEEEIEILIVLLDRSYRRSNESMDYLADKLLLRYYPD